MSYAGTSIVRRALEAGVLAAALTMGLTLSAAAQNAQPPAGKEQPKAAAQPAKDAAKDAAKDTKAAAPAKDAAAKDAAAAAPGGDASKQSSWVKLCDKVSSVKKGEDGKETKEEKNVCATFHDTIDANSGMTVVSAAIREVEGDNKPDLQVTVPLGMVIPAGAKVSVLSTEQTEKIKAKQEIDPKDVKSVDLKFTACLPNGCTAEVEAPADILDQMKKGGSLLVRSIYVSGQSFNVPVPLNGFNEALSGNALDNEVYKKARGEMMKQIRQRQAELVEKFKAEQMKNLPATPDGKTVKTDDAAPAADKK